jgi:alanine-alpha-ketoisovalerate/valine-pyruvate aminotransferase
VCRDLQEKRLISFQEPENSNSEDDLFVDLTIHDVSASLLKAFAEKVIRPYYEGGVSEAIKDLIRRAVRQEELSHDNENAPVT